MSAPLEEEIALRIGLAIKELKVVDTRELLRVLLKIMGEPITPAKLDKLRARRLRQVGKQLFSEVSSRDFEAAFAYLKGRGVEKVLYPKPDIRAGDFCELKGFLRVACASKSDENINSNFINCPRFLIYQVSPDYIRLIDIREPNQNCAKKDKAQSRASLLKDCSLLYTNSIGAAAAAKVVKVGLHPITLNYPEQASSELKRLQHVLSKDNPPPWLAKAMGKPTLGVKLFGESLV